MKHTGFEKLITDLLVADWEYYVHKRVLPFKEFCDKYNGKKLSGKMIKLPIRKRLLGVEK